MGHADTLFWFNDITRQSDVPCCRTSMLCTASASQSTCTCRVSASICHASRCVHDTCIALKWLCALPCPPPPRTHRRVIMLVQAGAPVDSTIDKLLEFMEPGDIIIDGGNEW